MESNNFSKHREVNSLHSKNYRTSYLGKASKKKYEILDIVRNSDDPPPQAGMDAKSLDAQVGLRPPPHYRSLDILTLKVWMYKIK